MPNRWLSARSALCDDNIASPAWRLTRATVGRPVSRAGVNPSAEMKKPAEAQCRSNKNEGVTESGRLGLYVNWYLAVFTLILA